ncbi:glycosyltransferase family 29 protein [Streptomyces sp. 8L]|uniref:glycosyltransferase family 29 protein n=1 Tax=Streptomyces sp. 8L TaxID=2877242 RepID=UPI001CD1A53C|nr:glycosyltransferase family 29 protein [Streptomyces sp. 8L]MCA1220911.1 glycosyltransferase family 29 protein [Streptomyces sp. 8L]
METAQTGASAAQVPPTTLAECLSACAAHSGKLVAGLDRRRVELAERLRAVLALYATAPAPGATPAAVSAGATGGLFRRAARTPAARGPALSGELLDTLIEVGGKALDCPYEDEVRLALLISATILTERKGSRAGWRLRARALEAAGEEAASVAAYQNYLDRTSEDGYGIASKVAGLRIAEQRRAETVELLERECPGAAAYTAGPATDTWAEGLARCDAGDWPGAEPRLVGALLAMARGDGPADDFQQGVGDYLDLRIRHHDGAAADLRELIGLYADQRRNRMRGPIEDPTFGDTTWLSLGEFRNQITGKSICLVANSQSLGRSSLGPEIDSYDVVVRFNSYRIDAPATGTRTDVHASIHKHSFNWDQKVTTRLVFGGVPGDWMYSLRNRLVPGAQRYLGDDSLRWPLRNIGRVGADVWPSIPTTGFNMLWLIDFLDVSPRFDLFGFDFYESGAYRVEEAMRQPITSVHEYRGEKSWVMERATSVTETRISLR